MNELWQVTKKMIIVKIKVKEQNKVNVNKYINLENKQLLL